MRRANPSSPVYLSGPLGHDHKRHGTTVLFAALNVAEDTVIETCMSRHRHQEWIKFLKVIDGSIVPGTQSHLVADNYASHEHSRFANGWHVIRGFICTSYRPVAPG